MNIVRSVTEVTKQIKILIESDAELKDLWIGGEVSNFQKASSGHCYFTLKDADAEISCVMWRNVASRLLWQPVSGDQVEAHGYVSVYERGGRYQFYVDVIERGGISAWWRDFLALKDRLEAEGLFDAERKRALPAWPHRIGVVTSPTGAALRDILNVLQARYPLVEVVLSPSLVQGTQAPEALVRAIKRLNREKEIDVVIVARGGGSLEDLWAFNDERVARAIATCKAPVVSGVGHETDFTIADFVADHRSPTPSAAAAAVVPDRQELYAQLRASAQIFKSLITRYIDRLGEQLDASRRLLHLYEPKSLLADRRQRVDELVARAASAIEHCMILQHTRLAGIEARLQALNPQLVLKRGYAVVQDTASGTVISSVSQVFADQDVTIHLQDGISRAKVTEAPKENNPRE